MKSYLKLFGSGFQAVPPAINGLSDSKYAPGWFLQVVFPKANDNPAGGPERLFHICIALPVAAELLKPVILIGGGLTAMLRTAMPKTSIHKHRDLFWEKYKIRLSKNAVFPAPADDTMRPEKLDKPQLCIPVSSRTDCRHHPRTLRFRKHVSHNFT